MTEKQVLQIVKRVLREECKAIKAEVLEAIGKNEAEKHEPMTVKQAAEYTGLSVRTMYDKVYKQRLPYYKTSENGKGRVVFDKKDLDALIFKTRITGKTAQIAQIGGAQ